MKKCLILVSVLTLTGCINYEEQIAKQKAAEIELNAQKEIKRQELAQQLDRYLVEQKDLFATVDAYRVFFYNADRDHGDMDVKIGEFLDASKNLSTYNGNMRCSKESFSLGYQQDIVDYLSKRPDGIKLSCYETKNSSEYVDTSDDCILQRRNHALDEICWFNYSKYLPENTKIKSAKDFLSAVKMVNRMRLRMTRCDEVKDWTTTEKAECKQKSKQFAYDYVTGNVKHCRDAKPKEWNNMLKQAVKDTGITYGFMSQITAEKASSDSTLSQTEANVKNAIGQNLFQLMALETLASKIDDFGFSNLCLIDGWGNDVKKITKK